MYKNKIYLTCTRRLQMSKDSFDSEFFRKATKDNVVKFPQLSEVDKEFERIERQAVEIQKQKERIEQLKK